MESPKKIDERLEKIIEHNSKLIVETRRVRLEIHSLLQPYVSTLSGIAIGILGGLLANYFYNFFVRYPILYWGYFVLIIILLIIIVLKLFKSIKELSIIASENNILSNELLEQEREIKDLKKSRKI
jgi:hypothetical protein